MPSGRGRSLAKSPAEEKPDLLEATVGTSTPQARRATRKARHQRQPEPHGSAPHLSPPGSPQCTHLRQRPLRPRPTAGSPESWAARARWPPPSPVTTLPPEDRALALQAPPLSCPPARGSLQKDRSQRALHPCRGPAGHHSHPTPFSTPSIPTAKLPKASCVLASPPGPAPHTRPRGPTSPRELPLEKALLRGHWAVRKGV